MLVLVCSIELKNANQKLPTSGLFCKDASDLINNSMFDALQSAYRDKHSTETDFIKVQNDVLSALYIRRRLISHFADVGFFCCVRHNRSRYLAVTIM